MMGEIMVRLRHAGCSHRLIASMVGWSKSAFYRDIAGPIDRVVSQLGQDEVENTRIINEWASQLGQIKIGPRSPRRSSLPRESEAARLLGGLAGLGQLVNRDPSEIVADMPGIERRGHELAIRVTAWLATIEAAP